MAVRLLTSEEYAPHLEDLGLTYVEPIFLEDGKANGVWEDEDGQRYLIPGVSGGLPGEVPMIPQETWSRIFERLKRVLGR